MSIDELSLEIDILELELIMLDLEADELYVVTAGYLESVSGR